MATLKCNYYNKIGCEALAHDQKATMAYWINHGGRGLMQVYCCPDCAKIVKEIEEVSCSSIITNNN